MIRQIANCITLTCSLCINIIDAQLTSSSDRDDACPGSRISLICNQTGALAIWRIRLPSITLRNTTLNSQVGSILIFENDPGFHFEVYVISNTSNRLTSELYVTAMRELDGVQVECTGVIETFMSVIQVAAICELSQR